MTKEESGRFVVVTCTTGKKKGENRKAHSLCDNGKEPLF